MDAKMLRMTDEEAGVGWIRPGDTGSEGRASQCSIKSAINYSALAAVRLLGICFRTGESICAAFLRYGAASAARPEEIIRFANATLTSVWVNISEHHHVVGSSPSRCCAEVWNHKNWTHFTFAFTSLQQNLRKQHLQLKGLRALFLFNLQHKVRIKTNRNWTEKKLKLQLPAGFWATAAVVCPSVMDSWSWQGHLSRFSP